MKMAVLTIVNLLVQTPTAAADWVLHVSYIYNATLLMSQGKRCPCVTPMCAAAA